MKKPQVHLLSFPEIFFRFLSCHHTEKKENSPLPPNINLLLTEGQRENTHGGNGYPVILNPQPDKLLQESVRYSNMYIAGTVCCPSRVSQFTGMHERIHGVSFFPSSYQLTDEQLELTYPALIHDKGCFTGFIGKWYHKVEESLEGIEQRDYLRGKECLILKKLPLNELCNETPLG